MTRKQLLFGMACFMGIAMLCSGVYIHFVNKRSPEKTSVTTATPQPTAPMKPLTQSQGACIAIAYEKGGQTGQLMTLNISISDGRFSFSPKVTNQVSVSGRQFATIDLARGDSPNKFWWCIMDLQSNAQRLLQVDANQASGAISGMDIPAGQHIQEIVDQSGGRVMMRGRDQLGSFLQLIDLSASGELLPESLTRLSSPADSSYTELLTATGDNGEFRGTFFSTIQPEKAFYTSPNGKVAPSVDLTMSGPLPQSMVARNVENKVLVYAYGINRSRRLTQSVMTLENGAFTNSSSIQLKATPSSSSVGVGHAFVYLDQPSGEIRASIVCWDEPFILTFDTVTGEQRSRIPVSRFFPGPVDHVEVKRGAQLAAPGYRYAITAEGTGRDGKRISLLLVARENGFNSYHSPKSPNGLAASHHWLAWDLRDRNPGGADELMVFSLGGRITNQSIPLGLATENRNLPSIICVNETR